MASGSLAVVGTGIRPGLHLTPEARAVIERADELLHLAAEPVARAWLHGLHPRSRSLHTLYREGEDRRVIYEAIVDEILAPLRAGRRVCAAFYGHAGVFGTPSHEAIRRARAEGFAASMLPAVSAADCLYADLGVDPGATGCISYDATDFLVHRRQVDVRAALLLWQVSLVGRIDHPGSAGPSRMPILVDALVRLYSPEHEVVLYEASPYPVGGPTVHRISLARLRDVEPAPMATLYVPPAAPAEPDVAMLERLGLG